MDLRAPALAFLTSQDVAPNFPIMQDKLGIGCQCGLDLGCSDVLLDRLDEAVINCAAGWCTIREDADFRLALTLPETALSVEIAEGEERMK
jgi:hypothetical protein